MATRNLIDPTTLSVEDLMNLLKQKNATAPPPSESEVKVETKKKCSFKPTRVRGGESTPVTGCVSEPSIFYGDHGYCDKHRRSVQALNNKKSAEEAKAITTKNAELTAPNGERPSDGLENSKVLVPVEKSESKTELPKPKKQETIIPPQPKKTNNGNTRQAVARGQNSLAGVESPVTKVTAPLATNTKGVAKAKTPNTAQPVKVVNQPVATSKKVVTKKKIGPNTWGRFEDPETNIVFDPKTKLAYGVQDHTTGKVIALTTNHIAVCNKHGWKYHVVSTVERCEVCDQPEDECVCDVEDEDEAVDDDGDVVASDDEVETDGENGDAVASGDEASEEEYVDSDEDAEATDE